MRFKIDNMTCGGCARSVTRAIQKLDPAAQVDIDLETHLVQVRSQRPQGDVAQALEAVGFPPVAA
jgi:copper chaperone